MTDSIVRGDARERVADSLIFSLSSPHLPFALLGRSLPKQKSQGLTAAPGVGRLLAKRVKTLPRRSWDSPTEFT